MSEASPGFGDGGSQPEDDTRYAHLSNEPTLAHPTYSSAAKTQAVAVVRAIVAKYPDASISDPLVAQDLVAALLRASWQGLDIGDRASRDLNRQVAEMLLDDPQASERLIRLWNRVSDENNAT